MVFSFKAYSLPNRINYIVKHNTGVVKVFKIKALCKTFDSLAMVLKNTNSEVLVLKTKRDEINYGCPALIEEMNTIHPSYERRLWVYKNYMFSELNQFLVYSDSILNDPKVVSLGNNYYLIKNEKTTTLEAWYNKNNFNLRPYKK